MQPYIQALYTQLTQAIQQNNLLIPLDILLVGATGVGKSSTINALFGNDVAKVGVGCEPETQLITDYQVNPYFRIHDSAGLGDGKENDLRHSKNILDKLLQTVSINNGDDGTPYGLIDMVIVILDGSSRDLGTSYQLLRDIILPNIDPKRVLILINQADMAMKGRYWNHHTNTPEPNLLNFLSEQANNIKTRLYEATKLTVSTPIFYSAECQYNIGKILIHIKTHLPTKRRIIKIDEKTKKMLF